MDESDINANMSLTGTNAQAPSAGIVTGLKCDRDVRPVPGKGAAHWSVGISYILHKTQRILDRMNDSETYVNMQLVRRDSPSTSKNGLKSTYADMKFRKEESGIDEDESPHTSLGPLLPTIAQTGAQKQEPKQKNWNRTCLICLVAFTLAPIVVGLLIYGRNSPLHHQLTEMEARYRSVKETKAHICELLTNRTEPTCPQNWIKKEDRCYFMSKIVKFYDGAREKCSELDSMLLEINSKEEKQFVSNAVNRFVTYWIGKCAKGNVDSELLYYLHNAPSTCSKCGSENSCNSRHRFICEKSAHLYPDIPEEIRGLCQQTVG